MPARQRGSGGSLWLRRLTSPLRARLNAVGGQVLAGPPSCPDVVYRGGGKSHLQPVERLLQIPVPSSFHNPLEADFLFSSDSQLITYDLMIVGAGPSGLSCAIEAKKHGLSPLVLDKGSVVDAIRRFPVNLTFFSTPELLEIGGIPFTASGFRPTRVECVRYYQMVTRFFELSVKQGEEVVRLQRNSGGFEVATNVSSYSALHVVIATGYFDHPNPFDVPGADLPKVKRYYDEPYSYFGRNVAVVGGRNSAVEFALDLFRSGANVTLIHRGAKLSDGVKYWVLPDIENRFRSGEIKALFETRVREIRPDSIVVEGKHGTEIPNDFVFVMIGYRPDTGMLERDGVQIDSNSLGPVHNPETMETNVKGLFVAGSIAAGKFNNKIFIENGRGHGNLIINAIRSAR